MNPEIRKQNLERLLKELESQGLDTYAKITDKYSEVSTGYLSQVRNGKRQMGEKFARDLEKTLGFPEFYLDQAIDSISTTKNNTGLIINGSNTNNGTQIGTQNNLNATFLGDEAQVIDEQLNLKAMPLFDIDDGVIYALSNDDSTEIIERAKPSTAFVRQESRAFGVRILYDLVGITNSPICTGDVLLVEPKIPPRNGDLVLLCLGYPDNKRGIIARLYVDMMDNQSVQSDHNPAQPIPSNAVICGVVTDVTRNLIDSSIVETRLNMNYSPIK